MSSDKIRFTQNTKIIGVICLAIFVVLNLFNSPFVGKGAIPTIFVILFSAALLLIGGFSVRMQNMSYDNDFLYIHKINGVEKVSLSAVSELSNTHFYLNGYTVKKLRYSQRGVEKKCFFLPSRRTETYLDFIDNLKRINPRIIY